MFRFVLYFVVTFFLFRLVKNLFLSGKRNGSKNKPIQETSDSKSSAINYKNIEDANYEDVDK